MKSTNAIQSLTVQSLTVRLALAGLLVQGLCQAAAAATVYTDKASFLAAMSGAPYFFNDFGDLTPGEPTRVPLRYADSNISYTISCPPEQGAFALDHAVSTINRGEPLFISVPGGDGWAVGGNIYLTDEGFNRVSGPMRVSLSDGTSYSFVCPNDSSAPPFVGFIAGTTAITSVEIVTLSSGEPPYPTLANFYAARNPVDFAPTVKMAYTSSPAWLGGVGRFQANASGRPPFYYQLLKDGALVMGGTNSVLAITNVQPADYESSFSIKVTNNFGSTVVSNLSLYPTTVAAWGYNEYGQGQTPPGMTNMWQVAGGLWHTVALRSPGDVFAWGRNDYGQLDVPAGLTNVSAVAAGVLHCLALKSNSTVAAWGHNSFGQSTVPAGLSNVMAVAAGAYHSLALWADGTVVAWGAGAPDSPPTYNFGQATVPTGLANVVAVACGWYHSLALRADTTVVAWGANWYGQASVPPGLSNVVAVSGGWYHSLALLANGTVVAWGRNDYGQTSVPPGLSNVVAVAAGDNHSLALQANGTVVAWGYNSNGQASVPPGLTNGLSVAGAYICSQVIVGSGPLLRQATAQNLTRTQSACSLQIQTRSGCVYQLEYKDTLAGKTWKPFPLVAGNGRLMTLTDPAAGSATRFYRVRSW